MKRLPNYSSVFLLLFASSPFSLEAAKPSEWAGLWRLEQRAEGGAQVYHLLVSSDAETPKFEVYSPDWLSFQVIDTSHQGTRVRLGMDIGGKPFSFDMQLEGESSKGNWSLLHPQYPLRGNLVGRRMLSAGNWRPFEGVNRLQTGQGLIDVSGYLLENAPLGNLDRFTAFWSTQVEPLVYPLIHQSLYGKGFLEEELKAEQLKFVYKALKQKQFRAYWEYFTKTYRKVHGDMVKKFPGIDIKNLLVTLPPFKDSRTVTRAVGGILFNFVDVKESRRFSRQKFPYFLAQQILPLD